MREHASKVASLTSVLPQREAEHSDAETQREQVCVLQQLEQGLDPAGHTRSPPSVDDGGDNVGKQAKEHASEHDLLEQRVEEAMELVEGCITIVFYDQ